MKYIWYVQFIFVCFNICPPILAWSQSRIITVDFEVIARDALPGGDGGNQWGGHQCRIVHTADGVFSIYTTGGKDHFQRQWHLMQRTTEGWQELANDKSGREPVNLMAGPDGTLYIIGWPEYQGTIWSGKPRNGKIDFKVEKIVAVYSGSHPYNAAGIDNAGNICVVSSVDDNQDGGRFQWAYYSTAKKIWQGRITFLDYRYCYTYVFPHEDHSVSMVSTRDVRWEVLGYKQPPNRFAYVFNAFRYWKVKNIDQPLEELVFLEEVPTPDYLYVNCRAMNDVYLDSKSNMHILYTREGKSTNGVFKRFYGIYSQDGSLLHQTELPNSEGKYCRIFEDINHRYFIIDDNGLLYHLDRDNYIAIDSVRIDLKEFSVNYSGYGLAVRRTGTKLSNQMDVVFPSHNGSYYVYFRLDLADIFPVKP